MERRHPACGSRASCPLFFLSRVADYRVTNIYSQTGCLSPTHSRVPRQLSRTVEEGNTAGAHGGDDRHDSCPPLWSGF
jgi:hypothetical protein